MGKILSQPVTEQDSGMKKGTLLQCGYTSMQGWRRTMEDSHIVSLDFVIDQNEIINQSDVNSDDDNKSMIEESTEAENNKITATLLAVFDGHGGVNVATYCEEAFIPMLIKQEEFKQKNYVQALIDTNIALDQSMKDKEINRHIKTSLYT